MVWDRLMGGKPSPFPPRVGRSGASCRQARTHRHFTSASASAIRSVSNIALPAVVIFYSPPGRFPAAHGAQVIIPMSIIVFFKQSIPRAVQSGCLIFLQTDWRSVYELTYNELKLR